MLRGFVRTAQGTWKSPVPPDSATRNTDEYRLANQGSTFLDYFNVLRRRKWIVLQAMIIVPLLAIVITARQDELWETQAQVALDREGLADALTGVTTDQGVDEFNQILNREAVVAKSSAVADRVVESTARGSPATTSRRTRRSRSTSAPACSTSTAAARTRRPRRAWRRSHAEAYLANRRALATERYRQAVQDLDRQIATLEDQGPQTEALQESLNEQRDRLQVLRRWPPRRARSSTPPSPTRCGPNPLRNIVLGILLGAIVGALLAFAVEAFDRRLRRVEDVERSTGLRLLGQIPELRRATARPSGS